jgi:hypothetical protein
MTFFLAALLTACSGGDAPAKSDDADLAKTDEDHDHGEEHDKDGEHGDHDMEAGEVMKPTEGAKVMFVSPADEATVKSPVKIEMGVEGMKVQPAGELTEGTGHHHILVDVDPVEFGEAVPADDKHIHFGKGQTETELELEPGKHTLTLQFADGVHRSYGEQMRTSITVVVEE